MALSFRELRALEDACSEAVDQIGKMSYQDKSQLARNIVMIFNSKIASDKSDDSSYFVYDPIPSSSDLKGRHPIIPSGPIGKYNLDDYDDDDDDDEDEEEEEEEEKDDMDVNAMKKRNNDDSSFHHLGSYFDEIFGLPNQTASAFGFDDSSLDVGEVLDAFSKGAEALGIPKNKNGEINVKGEDARRLLRYVAEHLEE